MRAFIEQLTSASDLTTTEGEFLQVKHRALEANVEAPSFVQCSAKFTPLSMLRRLWVHAMLKSTSMKTHLNLPFTYAAFGVEAKNEEAVKCKVWWNEKPSDIVETRNKTVVTDFNIARDTTSVTPKDDLKRVALSSEEPRA